MSGGIRVDPAELEQPARRFEVAGDGLDLLVRVVGLAVSAVSANAGQPAVSAAASVYGPATAAVLDAFADESRLLGAKIRAAALTYQVTDRNAVTVGSADVPAAPAGPRAV
jgi:Excreted virulence factor EspC, type VII ESX diderm